MVGFALSQFGRSAYEDIARFTSAAEQLGADSFWVGDRLLAPLHPTAGIAGTDSFSEKFRTSLDNRCDQPRALAGGIPDHPPTRRHQDAGTRRRCSGSVDASWSLLRSVTPELNRRILVDVATIGSRSCS